MVVDRDRAVFIGAINRCAKTSERCDRLRRRMAEKVVPSDGHDGVAWTNGFDELGR